ncbi:MAG TPA: glycosyltransferase family 87 protein [Acidobacteriaceae bacterium]|nr:glycosyltransferase family 87 protein [Acidobacteriaceae bacterium]
MPQARATVGWALLAIVLAAPLWHLHLITRIYLPANHSDLLPTWSGTRAALAGKDPYSGDIVLRLQRQWYAGAPKTLIRPEPQGFWYPGHAVVLFAPFSAMSWTTERRLFIAFVLPLLALALWLLTGSLKVCPSTSRRFVVVALALFSWPAVWGLRLQQITLVVAVMTFFAWHLLTRGRNISPGILLACATIKPQLVAPLLVWILFWAFARRSWVLIVTFAVTLGTLLGASEWIMPGWIPHWLSAIRHYRAVTRSSPQLETAFGHWAGLAIGIFALVATGVAFVRLRRCPAGSGEFNVATALALAVAVLISPFNPPIIYNYILLFPAVLLILFRRFESRLAEAARILLGLQVFVDICSPAISVLGESVAGPSSLWTVLPFLDFLLPSLATLSLLVYVWTAKEAAPSSEIASSSRRATA